MIKWLVSFLAVVLAIWHPWHPFIVFVAITSANNCTIVYGQVVIIPLNGLWKKNIQRSTKSFRSRLWALLAAHLENHK